MPDVLREIVLYLRLAQAFGKRLQMLDRDRALLLAGSFASLRELSPISAFCRHLILQNNHGHMIRKWESFEQAIESADYQALLKQVLRRFPVEKAETTLATLNYECDVRRSDYDSELEFVAAVAGVGVDWLNENFE